FLSACGSKKPTDFDTDGGGMEEDSGNPFDNDADLFGGDAGDAMVCGSDPNNFDVIGNNCDDDGDGKVDNEPACDDGTLPETGDGFAFVKAMGLCNKANGPTDTKWGVISATYSQGYMMMTPPDMNQHGIEKK